VILARSRARGAAIAVLVAVEGGEHLDRALRKGDRLAGRDRRERSLARRIARGALKMRGRIDWILGGALERGGPDRLDRWTRNALRAGLYQILYLSSVPSHAAVHETVRAARERGGEKAARLVNGVLRRVLREGLPAALPSIEEDPVGHLSLRESYPPWLVARWITRLGVGTAEERLKAGNRTPPLGLRLLDEGGVGGALREIEKEGRKARRSRLLPSVILLPDGGDPSTLPFFARGEAIVQDEGAALASTVGLPLRPRASVLDVCAAPGGKLVSVAAGLSPEAAVIGMDRSAWRMGRLRDNLARLRLANVRLLLGDGLAPPIRRRRFDLVLLDVPCTGLGTLARRADLRWRTEEGDIRRLATLALRLLRTAADAVEPGGHLVYSTCTTEPEENEGTVARFLEEDRRFRLVPPAAPLPPDVVGTDGALRVLPEVHGCDGAYAAKLRRREE
jgi:16S rRNA (cytosine967-C5)-methyltransferase